MNHIHMKWQINWLIMKIKLNGIDISNTPKKLLIQYSINKLFPNKLYSHVFLYSKKQYYIKYENFEYEVLTNFHCKFHNIEYTEVREINSNLFSNFDDMKLVGIGNFNNIRLH